MMRVLAVDVGLRISGYVVCEVNNFNIRLIREGEIKPPKDKRLSQKLFFIYKELAQIIEEFRPRALIAEKLYSHYRHPTTVSLLSHVKGTILILGEIYKIDFYEYSPTKARKSFLGKGSVHSYQVKRMAENILGLKLKSQHTADAFSLVVAFSHNLKKKLLENDWED